MLLSSAFSRILPNGKPGPQILHARGLLQGDPISPMLVILAIDPLHHLFRLGTQEGILQPIHQRHVCFTVSLYAEDVGLFVGSNPHDIRVVREILDNFGGASGLQFFLGKSKAFPVRCAEENIS
jgi:hypothetical protein